MTLITSKSAFHAALLSTAALVVAAPAQAQDNQTTVATGESDTGEAIVITGSRIARRDLTSASPLAVVNSEEFQLSGAVNVEQVINTLPQVIPGTTSFSNNPGGGFATLNLRGLGSQRTLVLVNGRRWVFFSPTQTVDLNTIPQFLIDSVDVVTGGASAVYGSDALAGVVNFRLRQDLDGLIAGAQYNITEEGDGRRYNAYIAMGTQFADGRGHVAVFGEYYNRGQIMQADRDWSFFALGEGTGAAAGTLVPAGSANTPFGRIAVPGTVAVGPGASCGGAGQPPRNAGCRPIAEGTNYQGLGAFFATPAVSRPYVNNVDAWNYAPENYLMVPQERWMLGGYGEYAVTDDINIYTEVAFVNNTVANELAATPITQTVDVNLAAVAPFLSPADRTALATISTNQLAANAAAAAAGVALPFGAFTFNTGGSLVNVGALQPGFARIEVNQRVTQVGSRNADFERNSWRALVGTRGNITDSLTYDVYYLYARNRNSNIQEGNISRRAFYNNVANGTCNVFGFGQLSSQCIANITIVAQNTEISTLQVAQASISGPLFTFGTATDPVAFAAGVEWRSMRGQFIPDTALASGDVVGFNAGSPTLGSYDVKEVFAELRVPIIQDNFIHRLELSGAGRYSDYSLDNVGGVWTYAGGVELAPIRDITFRGQYQRAVRAPNVGELFGGQSIGFPQATDPCAVPANAGRSDAATIRALCQATGVPASAVFTTALQPNPQIQGTFGGNPNLQEEVSDTWTVGAVIRPRFIPRLNITIDYFDIEVRNAIAAAAGGVANILNLCYLTIQDAANPLCQAIIRNPLNGVISGGQFVVRANNANLGALLTDGIDLGVDYSLPLGFSALGSGSSRLAFSFLGTWTNTSDFIPVVGLDTVNVCAGAFGSTCGEPTPVWKWATRLTWIDGPLTASLRWRHVSAVDDDAAAVRVTERIPAFDYFDLAFSFDVNDNLSMTAGVNNLFDKKPPIMGANAQQGNTWPGTYDVLGRDFFISAAFRF
ncbi:TonB-dependent receptor [Sphingosinicella sp. LHD-64]|uniref:TonB-dependent receptor domain-containing protein n=1 Tax=Sphingosinicella sp. LHD-64 TaxID=3072139 RepID=UPI00280F22D1|nr:TonB-dependent receptor [Sphingosinicella sp. LHD-64]MDQ8755889.1 TonB-dependent receptor [Sphingosinicella sp. LHD-64]